ncbi:MAG: hypothetical protein BWK78_05820, partial [Thiotrichaceae bacterium IS1]
MMGSAAWAADVTANVTKVSVIPSTPVAATATATGIQIIFELKTAATAVDTITYALGGMAAAAADYTAPAGAPTLNTVAGTGQQIVIATLAGSVAGKTFTVTANGITSNTATFTTLANGGLATLSSGSIDVLDGGVSINDGETQAKLIGETVAGGAVTKTLTIKNTATIPLMISTAAVAPATGITCSVAGVAEPKFSVVDPDATAAPDFTSTIYTIPAGSSADFQVKFAPPAGTPAGNYDCVLSIASSATNIAGAPPANSFDFAVRGIVLAAPAAGQAEIDVFDGATELVDNTATAIVLPEVAAGAAIVAKVFTIKNPGTGDLSVTSLTFSPAVPYFTRVDPYPSKILAGGTADFTIRFDPTNALPGIYTTQVVIDSTDSAFQEGIENPFNFPVTITVTGVGPTPEITITDDVGTDIADSAGVTLPSTFADQAVIKTFTLTNDGGIDLDLKSVTISGVNASAFSWAPASGVLPDLLKPAETTDIIVTFLPTATGTYQGLVQIISNDADENPFDIPLTGVAASATKEIDVSETTLGSLQVGDTVDYTATTTAVVGTSVKKTITISNVGGTQLGVSKIAFSSGGEGFTLFATPKNLDPSGGASNSLTFDVTLNATAAGSYQGVVSITNDDTDENPFTFTVVGDVAASLTEPEVMVWEVLPDGTLNEIIDDQTDIVDFSAAIGQSSTKNFKIKNLGGVPLSLEGFASPLPKGFSLVGNFPINVPASSTVDFTLKLDTATAGNYGGAFTFFNDDTDENPFTFPIGAGVTVPAPEIDVLDGTTAIASGTAVPVPFGPTAVGTSVSKIFTVKNTGEADLNLTNLVTFKDGGTGFTINSFNPGPVVKGASTTFTVVLNASASGTYTGTITFGNDDKDENPYTFPVEGVVDTTAPVNEEIEVWDGSPQEITAGTAIQIPDGDTNKVEFPTGTPSVQTFTVKNLGSEVLTLYSLRLPVGFSLQKGVTLSTVAPQQQVSFDVLLDATTDGVYEGSLELFNSDTDETPYDFPLHGIVGNPSAGMDLTVTVVGNGSVTSTPAGINACTSAAPCTAKFQAGDVTLTATPTNATDTVAWSNGCTDMGNKTGKVAVASSTPATCTATISSIVTPTGTDLTVTVVGNGSVTSNPAGINACTSAAPCKGSFAAGGNVTLTATPTNAADTVTWSAGCTGTGNTSTVSIVKDTPATCTATISSVIPTGTDLTVTVVGNGSVTSSSASGINACTSAAPCTAKFYAGDVILTATPTNVTDTVAWSAGCTGTGTVTTVTIVDGTAATCTATIGGVTPTGTDLTVTVVGNGIVTKEPTGETCATSSPDCSVYSVGATVALNAAANTGANFDGWTGACSSEGKKTLILVKMDNAKSCTATFISSTKTQTLTLTKEGSGTGTITSENDELNCGATCTATVPQGNTLKLTAT